MRPRLSVQVGVLLEKINDIDRASEYATRVNDKEVWSLLAKAQLDAGLAKDAIDSYIKAADTSNYPAVISTAEAAGKFDDLVRFLEMARKTLKEKAIDSALVYALAQTHRMTELEQFVSSPNVADIQGMGDRAFEEVRKCSGAVAAISCAPTLARAARPSAPLCAGSLRGRAHPLHGDLEQREARVDARRDGALPRGRGR